MAQHGGVHADMVLEKELRVTHLDLQATESDCGVSIYETSKSTSTVTQFLQQGYTYSNKAIPPNSVIPYEFMGAIILKPP